MSDSLRVLILEDRPDDAELVALELKRAGFQPDWRRVDTAADYAAALSEPLDLILADYNLPQFNALKALQLLQERRLSIPFIVVTGSTREEAAVECMQLGAADYLIKDRLARLGQSVRHALDQKRLRDESDRAEQALRESEQRYRAIFDGVRDAIFVEAPDGRILDVNASACEMYRDTRENLLRKTVFDLVPRGQPVLMAGGTLDPETAGHALETVNVRATGETFPVELTSRLTSIHGQRVMLVTVRDITQRKQRELELESIAYVSSALRGAATRAEMLPVILDLLMRLFNADGATLSVYQPPTEEITTLMARGALAGFTGVQFRLGEGIIGHVIATRQPYVSADVQADGRLVYPERWGTVRAVACVPLIADDQIIGAVWAGREQPAFSREELRILNAVADIAANALYRANVVETLEQRVTERTQALEQANERLTELDRLKSKFVSDVSHELRTPVTSLVLYLSLLERGKPEKRTHYLAALNDQAARLTTLIEDILDLSRLERDQSAAVLGPIDLNALIAPVLVAHQPRADAVGLQLTFEPQPDLSAIQGEPNQLTQVITNLVANAVNYTPAGRVQVRTFSEDGHICVQVKDTGLGVDPEDIPHLFDRFYRGKRTVQANLPGSGLGLAIVKEIVQAHGGTLDVVSSVGQGSTFTVRFPLAH
ncbi:MAG: PAS domain S-box protein [Chloroflexi bacterium]|nr:PAS domain S-box protein [Chloroflexota bacterium]